MCREWDGGLWRVLGHDGKVHEGRQQREVRGRTGRAVSHVWQVSLMFKPCCEVVPLNYKNQVSNSQNTFFKLNVGLDKIYNRRVLSSKNHHRLVIKFFIVGFRQGMLPMCTYVYWQNAKYLCWVQNVICSIILFDSTEYFKHPLHVSQTPRQASKNKHNDGSQTLECKIWSVTCHTQTYHLLHHHLWGLT